MRNKIPFIIGAVAIVLAALAVFGWFYYVKLYWQKTLERISIPVSLSENNKEKISQQLSELEDLRKRFNSTSTLTQSQINNQLKELETLNKKADVKPLTSEEIQKQLEELDKLKQMQ